MLRTILQTTTLTLALFLFGCGESTDEISQKDKVIILHDVGVAGCLLLENIGNDKLKEQNAITDVDYTSRKNNINCSTYGKTSTTITSYDNIDAHLDAECAELTLAQIQEAFPKEDLSIYENKDKSCVLSFNLI